jgi:hypothetical protein
MIVPKLQIDTPLRLFRQIYLERLTRRNDSQSKRPYPHTQSGWHQGVARVRGSPEDRVCRHTLRCHQSASSTSMLRSAATHCNEFVQPSLPIRLTRKTIECKHSTGAVQRILHFVQDTLLSQGLFHLLEESEILVIHRHASEVSAYDLYKDVTSGPTVISLISRLSVLATYSTALRLLNPLHSTCAMVTLGLQCAGDTLFAVVVQLIMPNTMAKPTCIGPAINQVLSHR